MASRSASIAIRLVLIVPLIGLWLMVHPERTYACSCFDGFAFRGDGGGGCGLYGPSRLGQGSRRVEGDLTYVDSVITEFDVKTVWKGPAKQTMYIDSGGPCGIGFIEGGRIHRLRLLL